MIVPTKLLRYKSGFPVPTAYWNDGSGSSLEGLAYRWRLTLTVTAQSHSSEFTRVPYTYNARDVNVGDWVCDGGGRIFKIISVSNQTNSGVRVEVEDVNRYNTVNDISTAGDGGPISTQGFVFTVNFQGQPEIGGIQAGTVRPDIYTEVLSRFQFRNEVSTFIAFQSNETFAVGDIIMVTEAGFVKAENKAGRVIGSISEKDVPGLGWYTYTPYGRYRNDLPFELEGTLGTIWYFDKNAPHQVTDVRPTSGPVIPVYLQLNSAREVMEFDMFNDLDTDVFEGVIPASNILTNEAILELPTNAVLLDVHINGVRIDGWVLADDVITFDPIENGYDIDATDEITYSAKQKVL